MEAERPEPSEKNPEVPPQEGIAMEAVQTATGNDATIAVAEVKKEAPKPKPKPRKKSVGGQEEK